MNFFLMVLFRKDLRFRILKICLLIGDELELVCDVGGVVDICIMVYVWVWLLFKKEKEVGFCSCVCIVNKRDVYLIEFVLEMDYLWFKCVCGWYFVFDVFFLDSIF